jgi:hypothetical protein
MLIGREDLRNRMISLVGYGRITTTTKALDDAGHRISRYLLMQLIINGSYGLSVAIGLFLIGVPYGLLWGLMAAALRYIPYVGPWSAALLTLCMSLLVFEGWGRPLMVAGLFVVLELFSNLVLEPRLYGQSIGVAPVPLLVSIAFWTWLWGPVGLVLATPLTVCLSVLAKNVPFLKFFDTLLGERPGLTPQITFYQRLIAHDQDEAADIAEEQLQASSFEQVYDNLLIPALAYAKRDLGDDLLTEEDAEFVLNASREIAEELAIIQRASDQSDTDNSFVSEPDNERSKLRVVGCAARDDTDETALMLFKQSLDPRVCEIELAGSRQLASDIVSFVEKSQPSIVCIAALPPGGLAHARLICKRLRNRFADLKIVVGRWALKGSIDKNREQLLAAGADHVGTTLVETRTQLVQLSTLIPISSNPIGQSATEARSQFNA